MEKRAGRPRDSRSRKISISVSAEALKILSARAKRLHGGNLSAVVQEMVATLKREEALDDLLETLGGYRGTEEDLEQLRSESVTTKAPRKRRAAA